MKAQLFVVTPKDYDPALNVLGTKVTVLASNSATQAYEDPKKAPGTIDCRRKSQLSAFLDLRSTIYS